MEDEIKNYKYLGRGIHDEKFLESLTQGNLQKMLDVINNDKIAIIIKNSDIN